MSLAHEDNMSARIACAIDELQGIIAAHYPTASFEVSEGDDPSGTYLTATVDLDDPDEVFDLVVDRLLEMEVDEGLPVYVIPVRTPERIREMLRSNPYSPTYDGGKGTLKDRQRA
jgi:hypothetical protein